MGEKLINNYLRDILDFIKEIEQIQADAVNLDGFKNGFYYKRTSERIFLIIGEIIKKLATLSPAIIMNIRNREQIIGLRNFLAHAYDTIDHRQMWLFIVKRTPELKEDILNILNTKK